MSLNEQHFLRAFDELSARVNALSAVVSGLTAHIHQSQGDEGLQAAKDKVSNAISNMRQPFGAKLDRQFVDTIFDQAPKL